MRFESLPIRPWRIGLSAHLDGGGSVHTRTFERALCWALQRGPVHHPLAELHVACDGASAEGAEVTARQFVAAGVDVVVGHYASAAASRAAPIYERAGIALLLPAASAPGLTAHKTTFRLCPTDDAILARALEHVASQKSWRSIAVESDSSESATALANLARAHISRAGGARVAERVQGADALFYIGRHHHAVARLWELHHQLPQHILLSDDCVDDEMAQELAALDRTALAFGMYSPRDSPLPRSNAWDDCVRDHLSEHGERPGVYYLETCAAIEIALSLASERAAVAGVAQILSESVWPTVLGQVEFVRRESVHARVASWRLDARGMRVESTGPALRQGGLRR